MTRSHPWQVNLRMPEELFVEVEEAAVRFGLVHADGSPNMGAMCLVLVGVALSDRGEDIEQMRRAYSLARNEAFLKIRDQFHSFLEHMAREMPNDY